MGQLGFFDLNRRYESLIEKMYSPYSPVLRHSPLPHSTGPSPNTPTRLASLTSDPWDGFFTAAAPLEVPKPHGKKAA
jgi:hypothetical protein